MSIVIDIIANDGNLCGEGPHWDERADALYWTDINGSKFYRYLWRERRHQLLDDSFTVNGFCLQEDGSFVTTSSQGAWLWTPGRTPVLLASEAEGQECRLNDCVADPQGRVYSGSHHLNERGESDPSFLFRIDNDGSVHIADEGICFSNGLALSPDCATLYFTDMVARCIYAYDWRRSDGALSRRRVFVRIDRSEGMPDGLTVDAEGFLWIAHWFGGCVTRYDPNGKRERKIQLPAAQTSSMVFGGPDLNELYVTTAAMNNCLMLAPEGYDPAKVFAGGPLYRLRPGVRGKLKFRSCVRRA
jgi:sugar lactone lactonase YvrE